MKRPTKKPNQVKKAYDVVLDCFLLKFGNTFTIADEDLKSKGLNKRMLEDVSKKAENNDANCHYIDFLSEFRNFLSDGFFVNEKGNKGVGVDADGKQTTSAKKSTMSSIFNNGQTGIKRSNYSLKEVSAKNIINSDRVITLPCYFKLWVPKETNYGILIVQFYGSEKPGRLMINALNKFLNKNGYQVNSADKIITQDRRNHFRDESKISGIAIEKKKVTRDVSDHIPVLDKEDSYNVSLKYTGLNNINWGDLSNIFKDDKSLLTLPLTSIGLDDDYDVSVTYRYEGKYATGRMSRNFDITPSLLINDEIAFRSLKDEENYPDFDSLSNYCDKLLKQLQEDMNYLVSEIKM